MTSIFGPEGQADLRICGKHRLLIVNQNTKFNNDQRRSCKLLIDLTWNAPIAFWDRLLLESACHFECIYYFRLMS